jgi:hypothetical protein
MVVGPGGSGELFGFIGIWILMVWYSSEAHLGPNGDEWNEAEQRRKSFKPLVNTQGTNILKKNNLTT